MDSSIDTESAWNSSDTPISMSLTCVEHQLQIIHTHYQEFESFLSVEHQ
jgi:hypothetical protein